MGLFLALLYITTAYLAPETVFGVLAEYHIEVFIALITLVVSLMAAQGSGLLRMPQTYAIFGVAITVALSIAATGLWGLLPTEFMDYVANAIAFFFVVINCKKLGHVKLLVGLLCLVAIFIIARGFIGLQTGDPSTPYVLSQFAGEDARILRIRGLTFLNDPNDLSQFIVGLIPCMFLFWAKGKSGGNFLMVYLPIGVLLFGMYLTHSRGGMIALIVALMVAGRRKIGLLPAAIGGGVMFVGMSALGWSGGRDVSAASGADRMEAWSTGLELIRSHPIFGIGYERFNEYFYITAHNSVIVCAAELGLVGLFFWMMAVLPTFRDAAAGSGDAKRKEEKKRLSEELMLPYQARPALADAAGSRVFGGASLAAGAGDALLLRKVEKWRVAGGVDDKASARELDGGRSGPGVTGSLEESERLPEEEVERISGLMMASLAGFLAAGWFLSRAYPMTLYVELGIAAAIARIVRDQGGPAPLALPRAAWLSAAVGVFLVLVVYMILRVDHLMPK